MRPTNKADRVRIGKKHGKRRAEGLLYNLFGDDKDEVIKRHKKRLRNTTTRCSCYMCGNPRKFFNEKTIQERKAE